jgi:hypothetical protein
MKGNVIGQLPDGRAVLFSRDSPYLGMAPAYPSAIEEAIPRARHVVAQFKGTPVSH